MHSSTSYWAPLTLAAVFGLFVAAQHLLADRIFFQWARRQQLRITSYEKHYTSSGPFSDEHWQGQFVYKFTAVNSLGEARTGWVKVGHWLAGVFSNDIEVIWDTPQAPQSVA